jgi:hypothetical protein
VALMVLREQELALPIELRVERAQLIAQQLLLKQLLFQPEGDRHAEGAKSPGCEGDVSFEQALEFEEWLIVKRDVVHFAKADAALVQAIGERMVRETGIMVRAREAFLLGSGDDLSVDDERRCTVVIECGYSDNSHLPGPCGLEEGIDERRDCGALGRHDQATEDDHHDENGKQPIFLSDLDTRSGFVLPDGLTYAALSTPRDWRFIGTWMLEPNVQMVILTRAVGHPGRLEVGPAVALPWQYNTAGGKKRR